MWTARIIGKERKNCLRYVDLEFVDAETSRRLTERHRLNGPIPDQWMARTAKVGIDRLTAIDNGALEINIGPVSDPVISEDERDFNIFSRKLMRLLKLLPLINYSGAVKFNPAIVTLVSDVESGVIRFMNRL